MSADPIEPAHDGDPVPPAEEPAPIEPGQLVELNTAVHRSWHVVATHIPPGTRGTVTTTTGTTARVRVVVETTVEISLAQLRRCD